MVDQFEFDLSIYRNLSLEEIIDNPCMFFINVYYKILQQSRKDEIVLTIKTILHSIRKAEIKMMIQTSVL